MGEIRTVSPRKTCGYPYQVCKKNNVSQADLQFHGEAIFSRGS